MAGKKRTYDPEKHCGGLLRDGISQCPNFKGFRTSHPGVGRCKYHGGSKKGGDKRLKHGLASKTLGKGIYDDVGGTLGKSLAKIRKLGVDVLDLTPEAEAMRAINLDIWSRWVDVQGSVESIAASDDPAALAAAVARIKVAMKDRPTTQLNPEMLTGLMERFGRMAEKIHKIRSTGTITLQQFVDAMQTYEKFLGMVLLKHLKDDHETLKAVLADIEQIDIPQADVWSRAH
jgi:hypothetical protein